VDLRRRGLAGNRPRPTGPSSSGNYHHHEPDRLKRCAPILAYGRRSVRGLIPTWPANSSTRDTGTASGVSASRSQSDAASKVLNRFPSDGSNRFAASITRLDLGEPEPPARDRGDEF
jgi:hypothetical protein